MLAQALPISPRGSLSGERRPRVSTHPPSVYTLGPVAGELMRRAGRPLDQWQQDSIDLMLSARSDERWACFEFCEWCSRQNGKGAILEARALAGLFLLGEELIMWSAHEYKTAMEAFRRLLMLLRNLGRKINDNLYEVEGEDGPVLLKVTNTNGEEGIERLDTEQRIRFVARSKSSGRGFTGDVVIIDETFAYTQLQQDALMPTLSARPNPQIVYTSSPPLDSQSGSVMFKLRLRGDPTAPRSEDAVPWAQDGSLGYRDWGLAGDLDNLRGIDLENPALWTATNPAAGELLGPGIRITFETIGREFRSMGAIGFARERTGIWPRSPLGGAGWLVISKPDWADAGDKWAAHSAPVAFALDAALDLSRAAVGVATKRTDGLRQVQVAALEPGLTWAVPWLIERKKKWRACAVVVDPGSPAASVIPQLEAAGVEVITTSTRQYAAACGAFVEGVAGKVEDGVDPAKVRDVRHTKQPQLDAAIAGLKTRSVGDLTLFERDGDGFVASAAALALLGHTLKAPRRMKSVNIW